MRLYLSAGSENKKKWAACLEHVKYIFEDENIVDQKDNLRLILAKQILNIHQYFCILGEVTRTQSLDLSLQGGMLQLLETPGSHVIFTSIKIDALNWNTHIVFTSIQDQ